MLRYWYCSLNSSRIAHLEGAVAESFFAPVCRKFVQITCHKGAGTKMHKGLVGKIAKGGFILPWKILVRKSTIKGLKYHTQGHKLKYR